MSGATEAAEGADAIVVAAGSSSRMGGIDKLDHVVAGRPVLAWSIAALAAEPRVERIVVVVPASRVGSIRAADWLPDGVVAIVAGGSRRQESVAAGLAALEELDRSGDKAAGAAHGDDRVVLVHDGARPLVRPALVAAVLEAARAHGAAIPVVPLVDTVKRIADGQVAETLDRSALAVAQTPQGVRRGLLTAAFRRFPPGGERTWTDEAGLLEACRIPVHALPGHPDNLKVTLPADLDRIGTALGGSAVVGAPVGSRAGIGVDSHPFGPGEPLALGGIELAGAPRLLGHSDGDVALHAVADALLGAGGLGDLGRLFPADATTPRGIAGAELLATAVGRLAAAGYRPGAIDLTIVAARPKLGGRLDQMRDRIAAIAGIEPAAVNVKASTGNLDGMEGAGRGISAHAIALVERA